MGCDWDPVDIASRARQYDPEAFTALFDVFFEKIRRFAYFHLGEAALADDLAAEVFRQAIESIGSFKDRGGTIGAWLYGIARNVVASHLRSTGRAPTVQLSEEQREILVLRFIEGYSVKTVAKILKKSEGAVRAQQPIGARCRQESGEHRDQTRGVRPGSTAVDADQGEGVRRAVVGYGEARAGTARRRRSRPGSWHRPT